METIITIALLDEEFKFKADENSSVDPQEIACYLADEIRKVEVRFPAHARKTSKLAIVLMAALNITRDKFELRNNHSTFIQTVSSRAEQIDRLIRSHEPDSMPRL